VRWNLERAQKMSSSHGLFSPLCSATSAPCGVGGGATYSRRRQSSVE